MQVRSLNKPKHTINMSSEDLESQNHGLSQAESAFYDFKAPRSGPTFSGLIFRMLTVSVAVTLYADI